MALALVLSVVFGLVLNQNLALALTNDQRYNSGYNHGCDDGKQGGHYYLDGSGGASQHTGIFMNGYNDGYTACSSSSTYSPSPNVVSRQNLFDNLNMCHAIEKYLMNPCSFYVDSNSVLSPAGVRAKGCISNGIMLSGLGLVAKLPAESIIVALKPLSVITHCDGIVNWGYIESDVGVATTFLQLLQII